MSRTRALFCTSLLAGTVMLGSGCALTPSPMRGLMSGDNSSGTMNALYARPDINAMRQKQQLMQDLTSNPDLPSWHEERQKLTMAQGDRVFDKAFDQVFDGMVVALATMGSRVNNMDRRSGYITGTLPDLGPERTQELQREAIAEYAQLRGYPPSVLQSQGPFDMVNVGMGQSMMQRMGGSGVTLTMVRLSEHQTKVKVRFDNVYYPRTELELYQQVWAAVDRQMFLDNSLDR